MATSPVDRSSASRIITAVCISLMLSGALPATAAQMFSVTTLVSNQVVPGALQDPSLVNAWGISSTASGPFWVSDNGTHVSTLYNVNSTTDATTKVGLTVTIPGAGSVTGQVFNANSTAFNGDSFLFVSEDGTVSGWRGALGTSAETLATASAAIYKGAAIASTGGNTYLYAANFNSGAIDVIKGIAAAPDLTGTFTDPGLPSGYAAFNIQQLNGELVVAYAKQTPGSGDETTGAGFGYVDAFDLQGNFIGRVASGGTLNAPWGLAIAPGSWGALAGKLLVGNFGDGRISAFNPFNVGTNTFDPQLLDLASNPLSIDGLWALTPGNGGGGGSVNRVYFTAGPSDEANGALGVIAPIPLPAGLPLLASALIGLVPLRRRR